MYYSLGKLKILYLLSDVCSGILAIWLFESLIRVKFTILGNVFFYVLLILLNSVANIVTAEYANVEKRGYFVELRKTLFYSFKFIVVFSFLMVIFKDSYGDINKFAIKYYIYLYLASIVITYFFRFLIKYVSKNFVKKKKKHAVVLTQFIYNDKWIDKIIDDYEIVAYISKNKEYKEYNNQPVLHTMKEVRDFMAHNKIDEIFINNRAYDDFKDILSELRVLCIPTSINISEFSQRYLDDYSVRVEEKETYITSAVKVISLKELIIKRIIDVLGGVVLLLITILVAVIMFPIVKIQAPGPLIFKQKRMGLNGEEFFVYKFRSMYIDAEERKKELMKQNNLKTDLMFKMKDDPRIFPFGQKIRDWSLDELPQSINVLKGEMSLVGTRPPTVDEYRNYELRHFKRLVVKPGITGLWQVSGRSDIEDFEKVVDLDMEYIRNWSIGFDIKILLRTVLVVLRREGSR